MPFKKRDLRERASSHIRGMSCYECCMHQHAALMSGSCGGAAIGTACGGAVVALLSANADLFVNSLLVYIGLGKTRAA